MKTIEVNENNELIKRTDLENTPFTIIEMDDKFFGVMANFRLTEIRETFEEAEEEICALTWNNIVKVMFIIMDINKNQDFLELLKKAETEKNLN